MRNLKKVLSLVLALMMVLSVMVTANAAFADQDKINADYAEAVAVMAELNILLGSENADGEFEFNPTGTLTRDAAAKILAVIHSGEYDEEHFVGETKYVSNPFTDVKGWAAPYVLYGYANEIIGGTSATTFSGSKELKGYEFAKMLLVAAGYGKHADYVDDDTQTWKMKTLAAAKNAKLLTGLDIDLNEVVSREEAAQMALNAMKAGGKTSVTYYVVKHAANTDDLKTGDIFKVYTDILAAYELCNALNQNVENTAKVYTDVSAEGSLLWENFGVVANGAGSDSYGRAAMTYTFNHGTDDAYPMSFAYPATMSYTSETKAAVVAADLKGYKVTDVNGDYYTVGRDAITWEVSYYVDGEAQDPVSGANAAALIADLTDGDAVVEVYTNSKKQVTNVVVVNSYVGKITDVADADADTLTPAYAYIGEARFENTAGYKIDDVVSYNVDNTGIVNVAPATGAFVGTVSRYTSDGVYTINGTEYELDAAAEYQTGLIQYLMPLGVPMVFYPGVNGNILYVDTLTPEEDPAITDYAYVLDTAVWVASEANGIYAQKTYGAEIEVLLADGTTEVWSVALNRATAAVAAKDGKEVGSVYYVLNDENVYIDGIDSLLEGDGEGQLGVVLAGLEDKVYTYADKALVANVAAPGDLDEDEAGAVVFASDVIEKDATHFTSDDIDVILNSDTVYIVEGQDEGTYTTVVGSSKLAETDIPENSVVIANKTVALVKGDYVPTYVAILVYAPETPFTAEEVDVDEDKLVLTDGTYVVSYDAKGEVVYTYTVVNTKGESVEVEGDGLVTEGIWALDTKGELNITYSEKMTNEYSDATVVAINGTTVALNNDLDAAVDAYITVDSDTLVVDLVGDGLTAGSAIVYITDLVYIVG